MKTCTGCGQAKSLDEFHRNRLGLQGRRSRCKVCVLALVDPEANRQRANAWNAAHPDRHYERAREAKHRRRALEQGTRVGRINYAAVWEAQQGVCALCALPIDWSVQHPDPLSKSVDHIVPICKGGPHTQENIQWSHLRCNLSKGAAA